MTGIPEADSFIKLISEHSTKFYLEKRLNLGRLRISLEKIVCSFNKDCEDERASKKQEVHFQVIENILFQNPHLLNKDTIKSFFSIKNKLDTGAEILPLKSYQTEIGNILKVVDNGKRNLNYALGFVYVLICSALLGLVIIFISIIKSYWCDLFHICQ